MRALELFDIRVVDIEAHPVKTDGSGASIRLPAHQQGQVGAGVLLPVSDLRFELALRF